MHFDTVNRGGGVPNTSTQNPVYLLNHLRYMHLVFLGCSKCSRYVVSKKRHTYYTLNRWYITSYRICSKCSKYFSKNGITFLFTTPLRLLLQAYKYMHKFELPKVLTTLTTLLVTTIQSMHIRCSKYLKKHLLHTYYTYYTFAS